MINNLLAQNQAIYLMLEYIVLIFFLVVVYTFYRFYYWPKAEIKRYKAILTNLGYKVYQQPFNFMGFSFAIDYEKGIKLHKDAEYYEKTVFSQVDIVLGNVFDKPLLFLVNPDLIREFSSPNMAHIYQKNQTLLVGVRIVLGKGLLISQGQQWKQRRKTMSNVFSFELVKENIPKICDLCDQGLDFYDQQCSIGDNKTKVNLVTVASRILNGVIMTCFFGTIQVKEEIMGLKWEQFIVTTTSKASEIALKPYINFLGKFAWDIGLTAEIRHVKECITNLRAKSGQVLRNRMKELQNTPKPEKISDAIQAIYYRQLSDKEGFQYTNQDLISECQNLFTAGTDTSTRYITMIIYYLGKYPEIHQKVRDHINSIIKTDQDIKDYEILKNLVYIDWLLYEVTRFFGPANGIFWRTATEDNIIKDIPITKGTVLSIQPKGNHFNTKYFKDPQIFRPQRWQSECDNIHPYAFIGFGTGPRNCIGKQLALVEAKIFLVKFIRRYKTIEIPKQELTMTVGLLYEPLPFEMTFTK